MKIKKLKLEIGNWKLVTIIIAFVIAVCTAQNGTAAEMKSTDWPNAGVVWTTAETTNYYYNRIYSTNFPNWNNPAPSNSPPSKAFNMNLSKKEMKRIKKDEKRLARFEKRSANNKTKVTKKGDFNPGWPTEFGPYYNGDARKYENDWRGCGKHIIPAGMYTDGEDYFIVYNVKTRTYSSENINANYDIISTDYPNYDFKEINWWKSTEIQSSQAYVQKIDKDGNLISDLGIPITTPSEYEKYQFSYSRYHITGSYYRTTLHNEYDSNINGFLGAASLVDCGKNLLISGQRTKPAYWYENSNQGTDYWVKAEVVDSGIYYVLSNSLEKLEWPSWCSGKFVGLSSGHKTSGRENKYIHAFGGDSGKRVWRLLPR